MPLLPPRTSYLRSAWQACLTWAHTSSSVSRARLVSCPCLFTTIATKPAPNTASFRCASAQCVVNCTLRLFVQRTASQQSRLHVHLNPLSALQGLHTQASASDAAASSDLLILCGSYEEAGEFLGARGVKRSLRGKSVLNLANGTPQEAEATAAAAKRAGARYLDACLLVRHASATQGFSASNALARAHACCRPCCGHETACTPLPCMQALTTGRRLFLTAVQSDGAENVFGSPGCSLMVSGDKSAWEDWQHVVLAAAPAAFYGGRRPSQANALGVALCTFMTSVYMVRILARLPMRASA